MSSNAGMSNALASAPVPTSGAIAPSSPPELPQSPLAVRDFRVYWIGQFISLVGMWTQMVAQGLVVEHLTHAAKLFAWISFVSSIPMALLIMPAGVVADRFERRKILIITQVLLACVAFGYAALIFSGHLRLVHVFLIAVLAGIIAAFDFPAQSAIVPQLVPPPLIPKAIALNQAIFHGSRFLGPVLAALLVTFLGRGSAFVANGISYFAVIYSLLIIKSRVLPGGPKPGAEAAPAGAPPYRAGAAAPAAGRPRGKGGMGEGLSYVRRHPVVLALIGLTTLVTMFAMPINIVFMPLIARTVFKASEAQFAIIMGASGLGALLGSLSMMRIPAAMRGRVIVCAAASATCGIVTLSFMHSPYAAAAIMLVTSGSTALGMGLSATIIQVIVPDALRGRVMGIYGMTFVAIMPPFALVWGYVADFTSLRALVLGLGLAFGATALTLLLATKIWSLGTQTPAGAVPASG